MCLKALSVRLGSLLLLLSCCVLSTLAQVKTTVTDTLVGPGGQPVVGSIKITSAQTFTSADGFVVPSGQTLTVSITSNGSFTAALVPNVGATPEGTWYTVSYRTQITEVKEIWRVPVSGSPVTLLVVRTLNPPSPGVTIPFPQNVPPPNCLDRMVPVWVVPPGQWACGNSNVGAVTMSLENPTAADTGKFQWKPKSALVLTRISCSLDQGSASINLDVRQEGSPNASGTNALAAPLGCSSTTGATTAIDNPNVSSLSPVALVVLTASGGVSVIRVHAEYKLNVSP